MSGSTKKLAHRRWAHAASERLRKTAESKSTAGLQFVGAHEKEDCDSCLRMVASKAHVKHAAYERSVVPGERIHSDVKEVSVKSVGGAKYAVCFVDDATRRGKSYGIKQKSEVLEKWQLFLEEEVSAKGRKVKYFRHDNGGEYTSEIFDAFNNTRGIESERSSPYCQFGDGVSEVYWRETFKMVRTILWDQQREDKWWLVALGFADTVRNHLLTSAVEGVIPEAAWRQCDQVDVRHFRVPLSTCFAYVEKENRDGTMAERRMKCDFIGYARQSRSYVVRDVESGQVYSRRYADVVFDEREKAPNGVEPDVHVVEMFIAQLELLKSQVEPGEVEENPPANPGYIRTAKNHTVASLARLFAKGPAEYLSIMRNCGDQDSWYTALTKPSDTVRKGSDVPVPGYLGKTDPVRSKPVEGKSIETVGSLLGSTTSGKRTVGKTKKRSLSGGSTKKRAKLAKRKFGGMEMSASKGVRRSPRFALVQEAFGAMESQVNELTRLAAETSRAAVLDSREEASLVDEPVNVESKPTKDTAPKNYDKAHAGKHGTLWREAENVEWEGLWKRECFEEQDIQAGRKLHHLMWVYDVKSTGRLKARLVLDGRRQDPSTYGDVRSPTMRLTTFRVMMAMLAGQPQWEAWADDATQAFINSKRPEDKPLWCSYPAGRKNPGKCMLLKRQLYGTHDAPASWFAEVKKHLLGPTQGLVQSANDECHFFSKEGDLHIVVHVDDFACAGTPAACKRYRDALYDAFDMTGGPIDEYYGLSVTHTKGHVKLSAEKYMNRSMLKLKLQPRPYLTPMVAESSLVHRLGECKDAVLHKRFRSLVGVAQHASTTCRPDVCAAVRELASHLVNPAAEHVLAAERVVQYLHHTKKLCLEYRGEAGKSKRVDFYGTCDASHNSTWDSRGISGWSYQLNDGSISWHCKAQKLVSLSSTESELIAVDSSIRELRHLHKLLNEFGVEKMPTVVGQDNMSTLTLCKGTHFNARTKHLALRYHHAGQQQRDGVVKLCYLKTSEITADALTKPLATDAFRRHRAVLLGHRRLVWDALDEALSSQEVVGSQRSDLELLLQQHLFDTSPFEI